MVEKAEQDSDEGTVLIVDSFVAKLAEVSVVRPADDGQDEDDWQTLSRANAAVTDSTPDA